MSKINIFFISALSFLFIMSSCEKEKTPLTITSNDGLQMRLAMTDEGYTEVITTSIIKEECYFSEWDKMILTPVSGLLEYYDGADNWVASIDFGNGNCDQWATKTWDTNIFPDYPRGSEEFSVFDIKGDRNPK